MSEEKKINDQQESGSPEQLSLNDDRRVKVLSPGTLVAKRFFRNRLAVVGLTILAVMFIFSFIGGLISPYGQDEVFYRDDIQLKEYAAMSENTEYRYLVADGQEFGTILQAVVRCELDANGEPVDASAQVRSAARNAIAKQMGIDAARVEFQKEGRVPVLFLDGERMNVSTSLSHHGRFLAYACEIPGVAND